MRACGKIGVCRVHQGPSFTNTLTELTEAAKSRTPLLVLAADTPPRTLWSNFKIDQGALARTAGALVERVRGPETAAEDTAWALRSARVERRTVVLNIPIDLVEASADPPDLPEWPALEPPRPSERSVGRGADLLSAASRPVILAGRGAALSGAREALEALGVRVGALLATSAMGHSLFAGHPEEHVEEECLSRACGLPREPPPAHTHHQRPREVHPGDKEAHTGSEDLPE